MRAFHQLMFLTLCLPAILPASDFDEIVREFSRQTGVQKTHIPFLGLARFAVATAHPAGTSEFKMAVFENVDGRQENFMDAADGVAHGDGWQRIMRVRSRDGEFTNIYAQSAGKRIRMLVTTVSQTDAVFIEMRVTAEKLIEFVDEHDRLGSTGPRTRDDK